MENEVQTETSCDGGTRAARETEATGSLPRGTPVGRYVVLELQGRGAMGEVYAAYDPELDRKVALKLLHLGVGEGERRARLIREARALARLSHPNVITVYDVGTWEDEVFLAMELVRGRELGAWLKAHPREWTAICGVFLAAGRALEAAHAAGLIHRDFKPANVLVAESGEIKVLDFGLATVDRVQASARELASLSEGSTGPRDGGAGTPAYMAPEVRDGGSVDAGSDIYAFCVSLFEALHGRRPFTGEDAASLQAAKVRGRLPETGVAVPRALQRLVARGLAADPRERFASMREILAALERFPQRRRQRRRWGVSGALLGGLGLATWLWGGPRDPVEEGARQVEVAWSSTTKERVHAALLASEAPYAEATWRRVEALLDDYARDWAQAYGDARAATEGRGEQSVAMMDLRIGCLRGRLSELRALVDALGEVKAPAVDAAIGAAIGLTPIESCSDVDVLTAEVAPPLPEIAAEVAALRERLDTVEALERLGRYEEGLSLAEAAVAEARSLGYEPVIAEALLALGFLRRAVGDDTSAEELVLTSAEMAERLGHQTIEALAAIEILYLLGSHRTRFAEASLWRRHARGAVFRRGVPEYVKAGMLEVQGLVAVNMGRYDEARAAYHAALAMRERRGSPLDLAVTLYNLAGLELKTDRLEEALGHALRSLALAEATYGSEHPAVARSLFRLGWVYARKGEAEAAIPYLQRALSALTSAHGPEDPRVAAIYNELGLALSSQGRHDEGRAQCERALAIWRRAFGDDDHEVAAAYAALGTIHRRSGEILEAERLHRRALAIQEAALGAAHPEVAMALWDHAEDLVRLDRCEEATASLLRATAIYAESGLAETSWAAGVRASADEAQRCLARILETP